MQVHFQLDHLPEFKNACLTIGTFDGVHRGHLAILEKLNAFAKEVEGESIVITFHPHPRRVLHNAEAPSLLTSLEERIERFRIQGIDHLVVVAFDPSFASMGAEEYIRDFLVKFFKPRAIVIGYDHRFGRGRIGDYSLLQQQGMHFGYDVFEIPEKLLNASAISSTQIRQALLEGEIAFANSLLTYPYQLSGIVIEGDKLGRTLGFPTANLSLPDSDKLIPASGVYAVRIVLNDDTRLLTGMMNIGYRPTVNGRERRIEVNIFDFSENIYGQRLMVSILQHTRKEMKFSGLDALKEQLKKDSMQIRQIHLVTEIQE